MQHNRSHNQSNTESVSRRRFLGVSTAVGAAIIGAPAVLRGQNLNEKLNIAIIGTGGRGGGNMNSVSSENIVALCDVHAASLAGAAEKHPKARKVSDFRKLYDHADEFDAVVVSTCEHTHAFATLPALQLGKHVYCEKPLTHNVWEARIIREAAAKANVATQMGTQIHAGDNYRRVVELIQTGVIGTVSEAHVWVSRAWGWHETEEDCKQAGDIVCVRERPQEADPIPPELDWDMWLGPAPDRPFNNVYVPGPKWYRWWDFGNGTMSDLGSHWIDLPFWALNLDYPQTIEAEGPPAHAEIAPASMQVKYTYAARGDRGPVEVDVPGKQTDAVEREGDSTMGQCCAVRGGSGDGAVRLWQAYSAAGGEIQGFRTSGTIYSQVSWSSSEWIHACKTGAATTCNFEYAGWLTEANHLGNVAYRTGRKLEWDPKELRATNAPEADQFIRREYRKGWELV